MSVEVKVNSTTGAPSHLTETISPATALVPDNETVTFWFVASLILITLSFTPIPETLNDVGVLRTMSEITGIGVAFPFGANTV